MAIDTNQNTIADYNTKTVSTIDTLLSRMDFVWDDQDSLITDEFIIYKDGEWKQGIASSTKASQELTGASFSIDSSLSDVFVCSLTQNVTISEITNLNAGESFVVVFIQDATGGRTVSWPTSLNILGTLNSSANGVTIAKISEITRTYLYYGDSV